MSEAPSVLFEVGDDHVATITLNRPDKMNAFDEETAARITEIWKEIRDTDSIHAAVVRAAEGRAFCTGIDVSKGAWWSDWNIWNHVDPGAALGPKHHGCWKPVIAAVHGMCAGGGMYYINEADIIICSEDATFFDPHASAGIVSALEPMGMLQRGVPLGDVLRWALMGNEERIGAHTALRLGLVSEVVERDALWARAQEIAAKIAARRPVAIQGTVRAIWEATNMTPQMALQNGMAYTHIGNPKKDERPPRMPTGEVTVR